MNRRLKMLLGMLLLIPIGADAEAIVEQPSRTFGYFIGDVLEQRIRIESNGKQLELTDLPASERVGPWLQRTSSKLVDDERGHRWLELKYQVINAPAELRVISLPPLNLAVVGGDPVAIKSWPVSISPLTSAVLPTDAASALMRPDRQPVPADGHLAARRFGQSCLALGATLLLWLGWWLWRRNVDAKRLPFAQAWRNLRRLDPSRPNDDPEAWFALHRAFNDTAGRTISRATIDDLIRQQVWLNSFESRIVDFYLASAARFFEHRAQPQPFELIEFGRALYQAEKRHSGGFRQAHG